MDCMRLPWTAEEAEKKKYLCEKCAPDDHGSLLEMLEAGTWEPLPLQIIENSMETAHILTSIKKKENEGIRRQLPELPDIAVSPEEAKLQILSELKQRQLQARQENDQILYLALSNEIYDFEKDSTMSPAPHDSKDS